MPAPLTVAAGPIADDSLRAVLNTVFRARAYDWTIPPDPLGFLRRWWHALLETLASLQQGNPRAFELLFWGLILILVVILVHGGWLLAHTVRGAHGGGEGAVRATAQPARGEGWYLDLARRRRAEGRYAEAMLAAFQAFVLRGDRRHLLHFHPGWTPAEYAASPALPESDRRRLTGLVRALYACVYAGEPCDAERYDAWFAGLMGGPTATAD